MRSRRLSTTILPACFLAVCLLVAMPSVVLAGARPSDKSLPRVTADRSELIRKLMDGQFASLNAELVAYEKKAESDPRFEMNAIVAFGAFETPQPAIGELVTQWRKAMPNSWAAKLAAAEVFTGTAQRWRGVASAEETPPENMRQVELYYQDAVGVEDAALAIHPELAIARALKIKAARVSTGEDEYESAEGEALEHNPGSFAVREQIMYALLPRWGGSREAMEKFADDSQEYADRNPAMRFLLAWLPLDQGDMYADDGHWEQAIGAFTQALEVGGEYWTTYRRRANAYFEAGKYKEALQDALRANELFPQNSEVLRLLAIASSQADRPEDCVRWSATYLRFEMPDPLIVQVVQQSKDELKEQEKAKMVVGLP
jgi:tetratricopeptide (TPR) repeat protein